MCRPRPLTFREAIRPVNAPKKKNSKRNTTHSIIVSKAREISAWFEKRICQNGMQIDSIVNQINREQIKRHIHKNIFGLVHGDVRHCDGDDISGDLYDFKYQIMFYRKMSEIIWLKLLKKRQKSDERKDNNKITPNTRSFSGYIRIYVFCRLIFFFVQKFLVLFSSTWIYGHGHILF